VPPPAPAFTPAPGAPGAPQAPDTPRGTVTIDALRQAWPNVIEAIRSKSRVAWIVIRNASVASLDEGVLTLRFPRQGDVKGFQGTKYEDLLKQELNAMFGVNVVIRAITGGGDAPSPGRRPGPGPAAPSAPGTYGQGPSTSHGQPPSGQQPSAAPTPADHPQPPGPSATQPRSQRPGGAPGLAGQARGPAGSGGGEGTHPFGSPAVSGADLPPLPPPPAPDDGDFHPDDEDMSSSTTVNDLTGMALVQRELGAQIIAEYED
jgi:DNA polymerase-3 subunit gamma/tau